MHSRSLIPVTAVMLGLLGAGCGGAANQAGASPKYATNGTFVMSSPLDIGSFDPAIGTACDGFIFVDDTTPTVPTKSARANLARGSYH
jgi:hypothetical protein